MFRSFLASALLTLPVLLFCQKPVPRQSFEFGTRPAAATDHFPDGRYDRVTGRPVTLYHPGVMVGGNGPEEQARNYLLGAGQVLGISTSEVADLRLHHLRQGPSGATVRLRQFHLGVPVAKGEVTVSITPAGTVGFVANNFHYGVDLTDVQAQITAATARQLAYDFLRPRAEANEEHNDLIIFPTAAGYRLAYRVIIGVHDPLGSWEIMVNARNGEILGVANVATYAYDHKKTERSTWHPPLALFVTGTATVFDPDPLTTANADYNDPGYSDNNDNNSPQLLAEQVSVTLPDVTQMGGQYFLIGPWAEVQDFEAPFRGMFPSPTPDWNFNRTDNAFEAANVYYHIDASMRYLNVTLGVAVQPSLYPTGVRFDPSGLNNADNSYYSSSSQRMAFGDGGVDDAEDSDVIHHELGHGLHDWITGGSLSQVEGLSEGCADYWAASYNRGLDTWTPADDPYHWVFRWDGHNEFWGGRRTNLPGTYPSALSGGIHSQGQVWSTSMMEVWDAIGQNKSDRILWEGIAMTNSGSNQNDAANAVYQAATNLGCTNAERLQIHTILTNRGYTLPGFVLPVRWAGITAEKTPAGARIEWATAAETNNARFTVERSNDGGRGFTALGSVDPQNERGSTYAFVDPTPANGLNLYRVRQTDYDGRFSHSPVRSLDYSASNDISIAPNPVTDRLTVTAPALGETGQYVVYDLNGRRQRAGQLTVLAGERYALPTAGLPAGTYLLRLEGNSGVFFTRRFVKR